MDCIQVYVVYREKKKENLMNKYHKFSNSRVSKYIYVQINIRKKNKNCWNHFQGQIYIFLFLLVTLFQIPQYEQLQILICNGNSLTTLAGVEHIKHLWKLDVGNNQVNKNLFSKIFFLWIFLDSKSSTFITFYSTWFTYSFK
jgi:hypothetical protein